MLTRGKVDISQFTRLMLYCLQHSIFTEATGNIMSPKNIYVEARDKATASFVLEMK